MFHRTIKTFNCILILILILLFFGCAKDKLRILDKEFEVFVETFRAEALTRSIDVEAALDEITIRLGHIEDGNVTGTCRPLENLITIDSISWKRLDYERQEHLIFHELGHCILKRYDHKERASESGDCYSFLRSGSSICSINYYSQYWRQYYINELFNESEEFPNWYADDREYEEIVNSYTEVIELVDSELTRQLTVDSIAFDLLDEFLIEIEFANWNTEYNSVYLTLGDMIYSNCNTCQVSKVSIRENSRRKYYSSDEISFEADIKLSLNKQHEILHFYVNEVFVHSMEYDLINGNLLETDRFDELIEMSAKIMLNN